MVIIRQVTRFRFLQIVHRGRFQSSAVIPSLISSPPTARRRIQSPVMHDTDASHFNFNDYATQDSDQLIFGPLDLEDVHSKWDPFPEINRDVKAPYYYSSFSTISQREFIPSPTNSYYDSGTLYSSVEEHNPTSLDAAGWINDPDLGAYSSSSPIPIPSPTNTTSSFFGYQDHTRFSPDPTAFSPASFAALHPLPRSISPPSFHEAYSVRPGVHSVMSPGDMSLHTQTWDAPSAHRTQSSLARPSVRHSPLTDNYLRQRIPVRRPLLSSGQQFQSSSAPSFSEARAPTSSRTYSSRADSLSVSDDRDATVERKKRTPQEETPTIAIKVNDSPLKSVFRPPKLAPSAWQLYFTDWIQKQQASGRRKLNVAQAAKEAGQEYSCLSPAEKEPYNRRSQAMKEARERENKAYMRTLTPEDIKRENLFRAAQRKAGKSRKSNIKDPNAPKKPLSAYFMFLQRIRASPRLVAEIFGDETETTKQSVLAAAKWRSMTDAERQPFLAQAEKEKTEYEAARRIYEDGPTGFPSSINFSILPGSPDFPIIKTESDSESEEFTADDGVERSVRKH